MGALAGLLGRETGRFDSNGERAPSWRYYQSSK